MPEGDSVYLAVKRMHEALAGRRLTRTDFRVPALAATDLSGRTVLAVVPRGKHMLTRFEGGLTLHTHFKMEGSWHLYRPGQRWQGPLWQVRAVLETSDRVAVGFRLPVIELVPTAQEASVVGHLGPDLLGPDWDPAEAERRLLADPQREIGVALLDQRNLAGLGNLWRCEALFLRGISPWTPVGQVADLPALIDLSRRMLLANKDRPTQSSTGSTRRGETSYVVGRYRKPCRRCGTPIAKRLQGVAPQQRETYWCPHCQPAPRRPAAAREVSAGRPHSPGGSAGVGGTAEV
jgi:endonuclease-8